MQLTDELDKRCYPLNDTLLCKLCHLKRLNIKPEESSSSPHDFSGGSMGGPNPNASNGSLNSGGSYSPGAPTPSASQTALGSSKPSVISQNLQYSDQYNGMRQSPPVLKDYPQSGNYVNITPVSSTVVNGYTNGPGLMSPKSQINPGLYSNSQYHITDL